ncbi:hypothetical protein NKDENANG_00151 [Candidatus Entotheonellaceae bacterium PAL068K]
MLEDGATAWQEAGKPWIQEVLHTAIKTFILQPRLAMRATKERVLAAVDDPATTMVSKISVAIRKCYGMEGASAVATDAMLKCRLTWPSAEWGLLPIKGGVTVAYRREIAQAADPAKHQQELEAELLAMNAPLRTAETFGVGDRIDPRETRRSCADSSRPHNRRYAPVWAPAGLRCAALMVVGCDRDAAMQRLNLTVDRTVSVTFLPTLAGL